MESGSKLFNRYVFNRAASKRNIEKILSAIKTKPMSYYQIAEEIHVNCQTAKNYMKWLNQNGLVYISKWVWQKQGDRSFQVQYFAIGNRQNAPKPKPMTRAEIDKRRREKLKLDKEKLDKVNAKRRLKRQQIKLQPELQIWIRPQKISLSGQT